jgi:sensor histidine kinase regulating citrate/malate metabolism
MITILAILFATNLFILLLYNSFAKLHEEKINVSLQAREKESYLTQSNLMQESMERVKSLRHDMKNHLAVLRDYSAKDRSEEAIKYVDALLEEFGDSDIYSDTGNIAFDSVINYKLRNAKKDNIALDLQISLPTTFNMDDVDIVTIFGNLLDNALEAVSKVDEKTLKIDIELSKGAIYAKIENSFNGEVKYSKSGVDEDRQILSSKSKDRQGYGIANTTKALAKYNGYMKFSHTDSLFSVGVFLYLENK